MQKNSSFTNQIFTLTKVKILIGFLNLWTISTIKLKTSEGCVEVLWSMFYLLLVKYVETKEGNVVPHRNTVTLGMGND